MKKILKLLIFAFVVTVALAFGGATALATDFDHCAQALQDMGLLEDAVSGFQGDKEATRAEAAVMLVSLLGAEQEALEKAYSHPFTDVAQHHSPYIGYMYEKGLTKGVSADAFNPLGLCDLGMYSTFVLRALGYTEADGDFTYKDAAVKAMNLGVVDIINGSGNFSQGNMAAISYTALFVPAKGGEKPLLEQLIEQGAVNGESAQAYLELYNTYGLIQAANAKLFEKGDIPLEMQLDMIMQMDMGELGNADITLNSLLQLDAGALSGKTSVEEIMSALDKLKFAMVNKLNLSGSDLGEEQMDFAFDLYLLDNVLYIDNNIGEAIGEEESIPAHLKVDVNTLLAMMQTSGLDIAAMMESMESLTAASWMPANPYAPYYGIAMIKSLSVESLADGGKYIDIVYIDMPNETLTAILGVIYGGIPEMMEAMSQMQMNCQIGECTYTLDKDGNIKAQTVAASVQQTMFMGTEMEMTSNTDFQMIFEITNSGPAVNVSQPDKDVEYVDLLALLTGSM